MKAKTAAVTAAAAALGAYAAYDVYKNFSIGFPPEKPDSDEGSGLIHELLLYLEQPELAEKNGITIDDTYIVNAVLPFKRYVDGRYDCADFRMQSAMRLLYTHEEELKTISPHGYKLLCDTFLGEKYWMTEPGSDSACYWSENHQLLFAVSEYLAGQKWPDTKFYNDGATGREHMERAKKRIGCWMAHRFYFGYTEFNSSNYYLFDVGPAANFIQFAAPEDKDMVTQMKICLDLLFYDIASNMFDYTFIAPTARAYADNMVGGDGDRIRKLTDMVWGLNDNHKTTSAHMLIQFVCMMNAKDKDGKPLYEVPAALLKIGKDKGTRVIKSSTGLDVSELPCKGLVGHSDEQIMLQFGMESFTNPEVIHNTVTYLRKHGMFESSFLNYFKVLNVKAMRPKQVVEFISKKGNPMPNGIAQQRANLYTYRTPYCHLSSVQKYHPGSYGAQQMLSVLNFGGASVVFTAHPARHESKKTVNATPGYWAGFGRAPHIAQFENVQLQLFKIPKMSGFLELYKVPQFTHTYLPEAFFDEVRVEGKYAFAKKGKGYAALIAASDVTYKAFSLDSAAILKNGLTDHPDKRFDLIQEGADAFWIYEISDETRESFEAFIARIKSNSVTFTDDRLVYRSGDKVYDLAYDRDFRVDNHVMPTDYKRFESGYITAERESSAMTFEFEGSSLMLAFDNAVRVIS